MNAVPPKKSKTEPAAIIPALVTIMLGTMAAIYASRDEETVTAPAQESAANAVRPRAAFDFYLLAMTLHASFCAEHASKAECRATGPEPLVIHGLWPERLEPRTYPRDCPAPRLALEPALSRELEPLMPGMADGLHEHEWREHGGCSGLDDDEYFRHTLDLARRIDAALGASLTSLAGRETTAAELRAAADAFEANLGATLTFHCRVPAGAAGAATNRPWLFEVRQCVDDDGAGGTPATALRCSQVNRRDQGCGESFFVAGRR
jgi:ribonuclease T2